MNRRLLKVVLVLVGGFVLLGVIITGGFVFAAVQESRDSFCVSCHTQPESTYYQRSQETKPVDLGSFHKTKEVRCIDCHSGAGLSGRVQAELLGFHNAVAWFTNSAVQPARLTAPIRDENCLKCHQQLTTREDQENHFHAFLARWQAVDAKAATCVSCHTGHSTDGRPEDLFLVREPTLAVCNACHNVLREGD